MTNRIKNPPGKKDDEDRKEKAINAANQFDRSNIPIIDSWDELRAQLLSEQEGEVEMPKVKLISKDDLPQRDSIAMASYSRSGNTMLRGYLEKIMGLATGSDGDI